MECNQCCLLFFTSTTGSLGVHYHCYYGLLHWSGDLTLRIRNVARASLRIFNLCGPKIRTHKINSSPGRTEPSRAAPRLRQSGRQSPWKLSQCQWLPLWLLLGWAAATLIATLCAAAIAVAYDYPLLPPVAVVVCRCMHAKHAQQQQVVARGEGRGGNNIFSHCGFCTVRKIYCMAH